MTSRHRKLPQREHVFLQSLRYHGYVYTRNRTGHKKRKGYVVPSTLREDAMGIDFWIKPPGETEMFPIQVTQRGVKFYREHRSPSEDKAEEFITMSDSRLRTKRNRCKRNSVLFILIRDFGGHRTNSTIAWGDIKALRYSLAQTFN